MTIRSLVALSLVGLGLACSDLKELMVLQRGLAREFNTSAINVSLNNSAHLAVIFSNSPTAELPEAERARFARHVAEYVRDHYPPYEHLTSIQVGFAKVRGGGGFTISSRTVPYRFTPSDLGSPQEPRQEMISKAVAESASTPRVLVIMISRTDRTRAWLVTGRAQTVDSTVRVVSDSGADPITLQNVDVRENAFEPDLLPHLVGEEYWGLAQQLRREVTRCIPIFVDDVPRNVRAAPGFLGAVVPGPGGRIFLMSVR